MINTSTIIQGRENPLELQSQTAVEREEPPRPCETLTLSLLLLTRLLDAESDTDGSFESFKHNLLF